MSPDAIVRFAEQLGASFKELEERKAIGKILRLTRRRSLTAALPLIAAWKKAHDRERVALACVDRAFARVAARLEEPAATGSELPGQDKAAGSP